MVGVYRRASGKDVMGATEESVVSYQQSVKADALHAFHPSANTGKIWGRRLAADIGI
jgi:hypothetical protein